jgi:hypothetical protein
MDSVACIVTRLCARQLRYHCLVSSRNRFSFSPQHPYWLCGRPNCSACSVYTGDPSVRWSHLSSQLVAQLKICKTLSLPVPYITLTYFSLWLYNSMISHSTYMACLSVPVVMSSLPFVSYDAIAVPLSCTVSPFEQILCIKWNI